VKPHIPFRALAAAAVVLGAGRVGAGEIVRIEDLSDESITSEPFTLARTTRVRVVCAGAGDGDSETMYAYGWILDQRSRQVVWSLADADRRGARGRDMTFDDWVSLPAGDYMASYAAFGAWRKRMKIVRFLGREIIRFEIQDGRKKRGDRGADAWGLRLEVAESDEGAVDHRLPPSIRVDERTVVQMTGAGNDALLQQGFTLPAEMLLTVYCIGEGDPDDEHMADSGWILDAATRKRVWALGGRNAKHAGGARKNRYARETIRLPAGDYVAFYATDGSHAHEDWNAPPPYDPDFWGLTVWAASAAEARRVRPYDDTRHSQAIVALTRQGNDAYATRGLTVLRPAEVRVYALGEYAHDTFADCGWIEEFKTGRRVWEMTGDNTYPAGGADKNRVADTIVALSPGDYVVYYMTDDSHAYEEWNQPPPSDPSHWGITLEARGRDGDTAVFRTFDPEQRDEEGKDFLVRLVRIGSDEHVRKRFHLGRTTTVHVLALGEGMGNEMYDYAWIESLTTGATVWEMTVRNTRHAGGADKNRAFDDAVRLERGDYEAHFMTDGSHAWGDWNAERPHDPQLWGITITEDGGPKAH
jgi:hypothetical protein